ncbi:MAG: L,D-transpeptidase family protein [Pelotomaculum sp.]|uniref:Uncharacterized protein conserved in bacteria n=1 Tax=Pelotomaculum thermopropionicum (strain DSM 13744 / JCM 10971 / SI) TaxID=370438 RepID=A5D241_PELTS|nr:L,D-transpeptidase family protein [Pelotomaculum sp.]BAF59677.1 Uncharacterized protein conserved in bacteria [Pelotomaculum thermopropionicum SI]
MLIRFVFIMPVLCLALLSACRQPAEAAPRIVINKGTNQLAFFEDGFLMDVFPVATGRQPHFTPEGVWQVVVKLVYPSWRPPGGGPVVPGGAPENPLGPRWLGLDALGTNGSSYGLHGNNDPPSIGTYATSGCVRMHNQDILWLYDRVPVGTEVEIINSGEDLTGWKKFSRITVNGAEPEFLPHLGPVQAGETTYLPVRPVAAALGYRLWWDESAGTLLAANIEREVFLAPGSRLVTVNNCSFTAEEAPFLLENTTCVPDYYFERFFGAKIYRDEENNTLKLEAPVDKAAGRLVKYHLELKVNGKTVILPEELTPLTDGENLLLPARPFCSAAGASVSWNGQTRSVEIEMKGRHASIPVNGSPALVNGTAVATASNIFTRNGSSYVSLRFLADVFGFQAETGGKARTLSVYTF